MRFRPCGASDCVVGPRLWTLPLVPKLPLGNPGSPKLPLRDGCEAGASQIGIPKRELGNERILAATQANAPSVIQIRVQDVFPAAQQGLITDALRRYERELLAGALIVIDPGRLRARILPLTR